MAANEAGTADGPAVERYTDNPRVAKLQEVLEKALGASLSSVSVSKFKKTFPDTEGREAERLHTVFTDVVTSNVLQEFDVIVAEKNVVAKFEKLAAIQNGEVAAGFNAGQLVDPEAHARAAVVRRKEQEKAKLREMLRGLRAEEEELLDRRNNYSDEVENIAEAARTAKSALGKVVNATEAWTGVETPMDVDHVAGI